MTLRSLRLSRPAIGLLIGAVCLTVSVGRTSAQDQTGQIPDRVGQDLPSQGKMQDYQDQASSSAAAAASEAANAGQADAGFLHLDMAEKVFLSPSGQPFRARMDQPYPVMAWFNQADEDHDGKISQAEFVDDAVRFFNQLDLNHDGYISSLENTHYENYVVPEILVVDTRVQQPYIHPASDPDPDMDTSQDSEPNGGKYIKQILGAAQYSLIDEPQPILAADSNFDFRLSTDEWLAASNQRFTILDRNGDGFITPDELPKTPLQQSEERPVKGRHGGDDGKKKGFHLF